MSNPLRAMMGTNPIMNPEQMAMNMLKQNNPQGYQMLQQMKASGQNPQDILNQMTANMNPQQIAMVKNMAGQFGIR